MLHTQLSHLDNMNGASMNLNLDKDDLANEIKGKTIVHWNYRGLTKLPDAIRSCSENIQEIYLKENKLTNLPNWLNELVNVTHLYLHGNHLKKVPSQLVAMVHLKLLDLSENGLDDLSPCIGNLEFLECLTLDNNFLMKLPPELKSLKNLQSLSVCNNELVVLPEWLGSLEKLEQLRVDENSLKELPNRLTMAPKLCILSICSNRLSYLPLSGFVSRPSVYYHNNPRLNYLSYQFYRQLIATPGSREIVLEKYQREQKIDNGNKNLKIFVLSANDETTIIELPRQLLKVYSVEVSKPVALWELSLRRTYDFERDTCESRTGGASLGVSYDLLKNGPIAVCENENCRETIFTEAWLIVAVTCQQDSISQSVTIVALYCSQKYISHIISNSLIQSLSHRDAHLSLLQDPTY